MVLTLVLLPVVADALGGERRGGLGAPCSLPLAVTLAKVGAFVAVMLVGGRRLIPWVAAPDRRHRLARALHAWRCSRWRSASPSARREIFGVSFALGAFFAGMVLAESELSHRAAEDSLPLRDAFAVLFFVSVGMLFDPAILVAMPLRGRWRPSRSSCVGKSVAAFAIVRLFGYPAAPALTVSASLAQIGEFSFILAAPRRQRSG